MSNKIDLCKQHNFRDEFKRCGGNLQYEDARFLPEHVSCFMSSGNGPYVLAADYHLLLNKFKEVVNGKEK